MNNTKQQTNSIKQTNPMQTNNVGNPILAERYSIDNVVESETNNSKFQTKLKNRFKRNVYIQKFDDSGKAVQVGFLHKDGKLKSNIFYNKKGQPIREIYHSDYGIDDYTAISDFVYDNFGNLKEVRTKLDDGTSYTQKY